MDQRGKLRRCHSAASDEQGAPAFQAQEDGVRFHEAVLAGSRRGAARSGSGGGPNQRSFAASAATSPTTAITGVGMSSESSRASSSSAPRSEEHTSELQSLRHLVCRLLLEKKKKKR